MVHLKWSRSKKVDNSVCLTTFTAIYIVVRFPFPTILFAQYKLYCAHGVMQCVISSMKFIGGLCIVVIVLYSIWMLLGVLALDDYHYSQIMHILEWLVKLSSYLPSLNESSYELLIQANNHMISYFAWSITSTPYIHIFFFYLNLSIVKIHQLCIAFYPPKSFLTQVWIYLRNDSNFLAD
jgi:hypothetical protein